jgi:hypothetical protein
MAQERRDGKVPRLEVALYESARAASRRRGLSAHGRSLHRRPGRLSEELFALSTNGGDEYCGRVIQAATKGLAWSGESADRKVIFITGNEPFSQGEVDYRVAVKAAAAKNIIVNTIYCGDYDEGVRTHWRDGALLAQGRYMHINHNERVAYIAAPQDPNQPARKRAQPHLHTVRRTRDGEKGTPGDAGQERRGDERGVRHTAVGRQGVQTVFQRGLGPGRRVCAKKGEARGIKEGRASGKHAEDDATERRATSKTDKKRAELQARIANSPGTRVYIENETKKLAGKNTLDAAIIKTVREQAGGKNFRFE